MDKFKPKSAALAVVLSILSLSILYLAHDRTTLVRQNRENLEQTETLKGLFGRTQKHLSKLFQSHQRHGQKLRRQNKVLRQLKEENASLGSAIKKNEDIVTSVKKENDSLQLSLKKSQDMIESSKEEKIYLEEMLVKKTQQIESLSEQKTETPQSTTAAAAQKNEELKHLSEQNHILQEKLRRLYKTTAANMSEINIAKITFAETVAAAKKKIEDEWNTVNLGSVKTSGRPDFPKPDSSKKNLHRSDGHILAVNSEHGFVVIDLGRADLLANDATLEVKKNGRSIATLSVLEIRDVMAACNIKDIRDGQTLEINDQVSILS